MCWEIQLQNFLKSQPLESQPHRKGVPEWSFVGDAASFAWKREWRGNWFGRFGLESATWSKQKVTSRSLGLAGLAVSHCTMVRWGEADDSLRLRYAAPTRLILRRPLVRIGKRYGKIVMNIWEERSSGGGKYPLYIFTYIHCKHGRSCNLCVFPASTKSTRFSFYPFQCHATATIGNPKVLRMQKQICEVTLSSKSFISLAWVILAWSACQLMSVPRASASQPAGGSQYMSMWEWSEVFIHIYLMFQAFNMF